MAYRPQNESIHIVSSGLTFENAFSIDFSYFLFRSTLKSNSRLFAPVATPTVHWYFSRRRYCCCRFWSNAAAEHFHFPFSSLRKRRRQLRQNVLNKLCETERNELNSNFGREFATYFFVFFPRIENRFYRVDARTAQKKVSIIWRTDEAKPRQ